MTERRLGRGLKAIFSDSSQPQPRAAEAGRLELNIESIVPNRLQPRKSFRQESLKSLSDSIKSHGILQPVVVREIGTGRYELIAGERRLRASKEAGLTTIPAIVKEARSDQILLELALLENLQREDLDPIEKGKGFRKLQQDYNLTQEKVAELIGLDRSSIANYIRLLELPFEVQEAVSRGTISMGHARAILSLNSDPSKIKLLQKIVANGLSVREAEAFARDGGGLLVVGKGQRRKGRPRPSWIDELEEKLRARLSSRVHISRGKDERGRITAEFSSDAELERIFRTMMGG